MRHFLVSLLLGCAIVPGVLAQETPAAPPAPETPAVAVESAPETADPDKFVSRDEFEDRIEKGVLKLVEKAVTVAGDELSDEERKEILAEVKTELESDGETTMEGPGFNISIDAGSDDGNSGMAVHEAAIAMLAISLIFGTPILVVIAILYAGYRKRRLVQETISQYLASGKDVPPEILENIHGGAERPKNYLQKGLVMTGTGLGIIGAFAYMDVPEVASLGLIPLFIGLAQMLIWKLEQKGDAARG